MNDSKNKKSDRPTGLMGTQFSLAVAQGVVKALEEKDVTREQLFGWKQKQIEEISNEVACRLLGARDISLVDPWKSWGKEQEKISIFYQKLFKRKVDWSKVELPIMRYPYRKIEYIFSDITEDDMLEVYKEVFGEESVHTEFGGITKNIHTQQLRPSKDYVVAHWGGLNPNLLCVQYSEIISHGIKAMIPKEGIIAAFRQRFETGECYDITHATQFASLGLEYKEIKKNGMFMDYTGNQLHMSKIHHLWGFREVDLLPF